ncbi:MAG TPA: nucleotide disphospho-sugar-binding domain-containing protein [Polyangiaceae bacterium]|jgi:MGT family glycosyltransferase
MWEGGGTAPPELAVASRLVSRGHHVAVIGDPSLEADVASAGARFLPWREAPHRATRTRESEIVRDWAAMTPLGAFARARDRHAFAPAHLFARELLEAFRAAPADVVACDAMLFGGLIGAEASGARVAALLPMTSFLPARGRPPAALGLRPARGALGRARDRLLEGAGDVLLWRSCLPLLNSARREVGLAPVAHPLDQIRRADRVLVQTSAWFDFDAPLADGNVRYVGPEIGDPAWASRDAGEFEVLVAFSTTFMGQEALLERVASALGEMRVRAIVTTGSSIDPSAIRAPPNVTVRASASHAAILPHASLVVTHGGHGTVIRALAYGVPVVCMPMGRDQSDNAARAEAIGAGVTLSHRASTARIRRTIERALGDSSLHEGARRARDRIANEMQSDRAIAELEGLLEVRRD